MIKNLAIRFRLSYRLMDPRNRARPVESNSVAKILFLFDDESEDDVLMSEPDDPLLLEIWNATQKNGVLTPPATTIKRKEKRPVLLPVKRSPVSKKHKFHFDSSDEDETPRPVVFDSPVIKTSEVSKLNKLHESTKAGLNLYHIKGESLKEKPVERVPVVQDVDEEWPMELSPCFEDVELEDDAVDLPQVEKDVKEGIKIAPMKKSVKEVEVEKIGPVVTKRVKEEEIEKAGPVMKKSVVVEIKSSMLSFLINCRVELWMLTRSAQEARSLREHSCRRPRGYPGKCH
jgi:hypothetical protein